MSEFNLRHHKGDIICGFTEVHFSLIDIIKLLFLGKLTVKTVVAVSNPKVDVVNTESRTSVGSILKKHTKEKEDLIASQENEAIGIHVEYLPPLVTYQDSNPLVRRCPECDGRKFVKAIAGRQRCGTCKGKGYVDSNN